MLDEEQPETPPAIRRELAKLRKEQVEALQKARFIPMSTADEARYNARRIKIMELVRALDALGK